METNKNPGGRPPKFKTPEELEAKAEEYYRWCDANPIRIYKSKGAGVSRAAANGSGEKADEGEKFVDRPYTIDGLALHCGIGNWYQWRDDQPEEFRSIINALEARVRDKQVVGALAGVYNTNLTARLNHIAENVNENQSLNLQIIDFGDE